MLCTELSALGSVGVGVGTLFGAMVSVGVRPVGVEAKGFTSGETVVLVAVSSACVRAVGLDLS